jgi:tetratricopeptide (TPR) repeat protein
VSVGLSDIVAKCVARRPEDRYGDAAALADDLRRHWTDQPLAGVPNRSVAERWHKWRRRRPSTFRTAGMLAVVAAAAAILLAGTWSQMRDRVQQAERALSDGRSQVQNGQNYAESVRTFERGVALAESVPFQRDLQRQLREELATAKRLHVAQQLHDLADEIRVLYGTDSIPAAHLESVASQCRAFWAKRQLIVDALTLTRRVSEGPPELSPRLRVGLVSDVSTDLQDIAIFAAALQVKLSHGSDSTAARREALRWLDEAEAMFGPSAVLEYERRVHRQAMGLAESSEPSLPREESPAPRTAWEHYALGRAFLTSDDLSRASEELAVALELDPAGRWPNFYYGLCACRMRRFDDAVAAFSVCIGAAPNIAGCYYNRALAYAGLGRLDQAIADYDRALAIDPAHAAAALNRGVLHYEQKRFDQAIADLRLALEHGADPATVHYDLALIHLAAGAPTTAFDNLQRALEHNPDHEQARQIRDSLQHKSRESKTGR